MHTPLHQEVILRNSFETGNNTERPGHRRNLHILALSLAGWPNHHCKFVSKVCRDILDEFKEECLSCPTDSEYWKKWRRSSEPYGMFPTRWEAYHHEEAKEIWE